MSETEKQAILDTLRSVYDPDLDRDIVSLSGPLQLVNVEPTSAGAVTMAVSPKS